MKKLKLYKARTAILTFVLLFINVDDLCFHNTNVLFFRQNKNLKKLYLQHYIMKSKCLKCFTTLISGTFLLDCFEKDSRHFLNYAFFAVIEFGLIF